MVIVLGTTSTAFITWSFFVSEPKRVLPKLLAGLPAVLLTCLFFMKPVTAMMAFR